MPGETHSAAPYSLTEGIRLVRHLLATGRYVFTTDDAAAAAGELGVAGSYLPRLLSALVEGGWLLRLRRGLYGCTGEIAGTVSIHPYAVATSLVSPSAISHWSALSHHGFTEQVPRDVSATTPRRFVTPTMRGSSDEMPQRKHAWEVAGTRYEYVSVKSERFFGHELVWVDERFRVPITDGERTVLDCFAFPHLIGGFSEALAILSEYWTGLDLTKLVAYAVRFGQGATIKRLGWALDEAGAPSDDLRPLLDYPIAGHRVLDPSRPRRGPCDKRWMVQNNLQGDDAK